MSATPASNSLHTRSRFNGNNQRTCAGVEYKELFPSQLTRTDQLDRAIYDRYRIITIPVTNCTLIGQNRSADRGIMPRNPHLRARIDYCGRVGKELLAGVADENLGSVPGKSGIELHPSVYGILHPR